MSKVAVVYWSSTGNTEAMANAVVDGAKEKGADVTLYECADFRPELVADYDAIAFGCPAMGDEVLEEDESHSRKVVGICRETTTFLSFPT